MKRILHVCGWILTVACALALAGCDSGASDHMPNTPSATVTSAPVITQTPTTIAPTPEPTARVLRRATPAASPSPSDLNVTLVRSGGLIGRPQTYVLTSDGSVDTGFARLRVEGGATAMQQLAQNIRATGLLDVPPANYAPANVCCDRYAYELTISVDGKAYVYETIVGSPSVPPALTQTIALIESYIATAR